MEARDESSTPVHSAPSRGPLTGIRVVELALRLKKKRPIDAVELPGALIARSLANRGGEIVNRHSAHGQRRRVGLDSHRRLRAIHLHRAHAADDADALADLRVGQIVQLPARHGVAGERDIEDRLIIGIGLGEGRRAGQIDGELSRRAGDHEHDRATDHEKNINAGVADGRDDLMRRLVECIVAKAGHDGA